MRRTREYASGKWTCSTPGWPRPPHTPGCPSAIYDADGRNLNPTLPDLRQSDLEVCPHRALVTDRDAALVARIWLLADDATPAAIPPVLMTEAVQLVLAGKGIVILARRPEPKVDVRTGLLHALDLAIAPMERGGVERV